ncbi:hypothetical protein L873DRAFT_1792710 [Choiromyces venosus 120613-1]|uniref:Uncharacterized protein n=1 Tax=Choiromyces venosus 120613-1 TaxID=1336337 RepID=A0A3N4JCU5_9PEZI|nr:hypothetical protein L873DRAFT_1792710 [Choiromyces venosus 120613-1]
MSHLRHSAPSSTCTLPLYQSQTIHIRELGQLPPTPRGTRQWTIQITSGSYNITRILTDPFNAQSETRLRWALEEHAQKAPFEDQKAADISQELWGYSMSLMEQLRLTEIISSLSKSKKKRASEEGMTPEASMQGIKGKKWFVDIGGWGWNSVEGAQEACMNGIHWEALENPDVWPTQIRPCIIVRRRVPSANIVTRVPIVGVGSDTFRILLVVSHPMSVVTSGRKTASPRLVSRPLVDLVERLKTECGAPVYLEVLRPASWRALEEKLIQSEKGFWHLVHFDVNARVTKVPQKKTPCQKASADKDEVSLSFVSERCPQKRTWRTAREISSLLVSNGIKFVILNAPRTAKSFGVVSSNFAEALVQEGIRAVVALPNKILNAGAEVLMSTFYRCFLAETRDLAVALSEARRAMMRVKKREGRFGVMIPVDDWIVPILYHNGATEVSVIGNDLTNFTAASRNTVPDPKRFLSKFQGLLSGDHTRSPDAIIADKVLTGNEAIPGREYDIFKMEQLLDNNILHLTGVPGVGKTKLMAHLGWWWKATSLVEDSFYFDYDKQPSLTPEMLLLEIYFQLFSPTPVETHRKSSRTTSPRPPPVCPIGSFLTQWPVSASPQSSPTSDTSDDIGDDCWMEKTLDRLKERPYLIVLDSLESSEAEIKDDEVLRGEVNEFLKMLQGGKSVVIVVGNKKESWLNDSLVRFGTYHLNRLDIDQAVDLAGSILEKHGRDRKRFQSVENKHYLEMLLQLCDFNPLIMELTLPKVAQNSLTPLEILFDTLRSETTLTYAPAIKPLRNLSSFLSRLDKDSKQLLLCIAPFHTRLPKDINPYLHCLLYHKALPTTADASTMQFLLSRPPSIHENQRVTTILSSTGLLARYSYIVRDLLTKDFLQEDSSSTSYHIHPLLTLFLRQTVSNERERANSSYGVEYPLVTHAFLDYYSQRSFLWSQTPAETYLSVEKELELEENNFLEAIWTPLTHVNPASIFSSFPVHAFARYASIATMQNMRLKVGLVKEICIKILKRFEELKEKIGRGGKVDDKALVVALFASGWLCEYHAEEDAIAEFKKQVEVSIELIGMGKDTGGCLEKFSVLGEQCSVQKSVAVQDGMADGLKFRKPWAGFLAEYQDPKKKKKEEGNAQWSALAKEFIRLQSIAVQIPLTERFNDKMRLSLKGELSNIYSELDEVVRRSPLYVFLSVYPWIPAALHNPLPSQLPKLSSKEFVAYPSLLQLHQARSDPPSTLPILQNLLTTTRTHSLQELELPTHIILAKQTFTLQSLTATLSHCEYIATLLPPSPHLLLHHLPTLLHITFLAALTHTHLHAWEFALSTFNVALSLAVHLADTTTQYCTLRKLSAIKRESGLGPPVAETLLRALDLSYATTSQPAFTDEHGVLLQRILSAARSGKAGESIEHVVERFAMKRGWAVSEMKNFVEDVIALEAKIVRGGVEMGVRSAETERGLKGMYAEAEKMLFARKKRSRAESGAGKSITSYRTV